MGRQTSQVAMLWTIMRKEPKAVLKTAIQKVAMQKAVLVAALAPQSLFPVRRTCLE